MASKAASETPSGSTGAAGSTSMSATVVPYPPAAISRRQIPRPAVRENVWLERARGAAARIMPTLLTVAALLLVWQILCGGEGSPFPSPV